MHVVIADMSARRWSEAPTISDSKGKFTIKGLAPTDTVPLRARSEFATTDGAVIVVPVEQKGAVRLVISESQAFRVHGEVTDKGGHPIADAAVELEWGRDIVTNRQNVGSSLSGVFRRNRTAADGSFQFTGLWPGDRYRVTAKAEGYSKVESAPVAAKAGQIHDFGRLRLLGAGTIILGRVIDSAGQRVAGVRVFNAGDAPRPVTSRSDAQGNFRLGDLNSGPVYVFADKAGYRFTGVRIRSGGPNVTIKLLKANEAPPTAPREAGERAHAEEREVARKMLDPPLDAPRRTTQAISASTRQGHDASRRCPGNPLGATSGTALPRRGSPYGSEGCGTNRRRRSACHAYASRRL